MSLLEKVELVWELAKNCRDQGRLMKSTFILQKYSHRDLRLLVLLLGWILEKWDGVMWTGLVWLRIGTGGESSCEFGIEPSGPMKCWETIE
jgi:hypothetical protein